MKHAAKAGRLIHVDMLRGLAMVAMISIHTNAYFLSNKVAGFLWDLGQFAVPLFIFCSGYLFFKKDFHIRLYFHYIKKRFRRFLVPYYFFLIFYLSLVYLKEPAKITFKYFLENLLVIGGVDINWLVLLFICFSFILPPFYHLVHKHKSWFYFFVFISFFSSLTLVFFSFPFNYRLIMWLPWFLIIIFSYWLVKNEKNNLLQLAVFIFFVFTFLLLRYLQVINHHSLIQYYNKYPPNLYHLSYGIIFIIGLFWLTKRKEFNFFPLKKLLEFLSVNSYSIYFIHILVIYIITVFFKLKLTWVGFFITVLLSTIFVQVVINKTIFFLRYKVSQQSECWPVRAD